MYFYIAFFNNFVNNFASRNGYTCIVEKKGENYE